MVKNTWSCITSELSPAGMPSLMADEQQAELADADGEAVGDEHAAARPCGRRMKNTAGSAATT